jgi:glycosyltransferase involved in cell wall biosynthesis
MSDKALKVNLFSMGADGILGKFNRRMEEELLKMGVDVKITDKYDPTADVNHYPLYTFINHPTQNHEHDTFMITHVDCASKVELLRTRVKSYGMGICMSKQTLDFLTANGVPREKLCYINPAHDHIIKPRKYTVGLTYKVYDDYRKRDEFLIDIAKNIDKDLFRFVIMGEGWSNIVDELVGLGIEVVYYDHFDYDKYLEIVPTFDFFLYFGYDEGNMGYLDALAAGVETIVTPQGYHLDAKGGLTYPCNTLDDYVKVFDEIAMRKKSRIASVQDWTWENFSKKHLEIWNYLMGNVPLSETFKNRGLYSDGIFSVLPKEIGEGTMLANDLENRHYIRAMKNIINKS